MVLPTASEHGGVRGAEAPPLLPMNPPSRSIDVESLLEHRPFLTNLVRGLLADEHGVEDVVQETWVRALQSPPRFAKSPRAWLGRVARNLALNHRRGAQRRVDRERTASRPPLSSPEEVAEDLGRQRRVLDAVLALPEPLRSTIHSRYFDDFSPHEIARRTDTSVHTVNDRLRRGRQQLRERLASEIGDGERGWALALLPLASLGAKTDAIVRAQILGMAPATSAVTVGTLPLLGGLLVTKTSLAAFTIAAVGLGGALWFAAGLGDSSGVEATSGDVRKTASLRATDPLSGDAGAPILVGASRREESGARTELPAAEPSRKWTVAGDVWSEQGGAVSGVAIQAGVHAGSERTGELLREATLISDAEGRFEWSLPAPDETVTIVVESESEAHSSGVASAVVARGEPAPQNLRFWIFPLDCHVEGTVRDNSGNPVSGAEVRRMRRLAPPVLTDDQGHYRLAIPSRWESMIHASAEGLAQVHLTVNAPAPGKIAVVDIELPPALCVQGRVLDEAGVPIVGAEVRVSDVGKHVAESGPHGCYALEHLNSEREKHHLRVSAPGYVILADSVSTVTGGVVEHDIVLPRGALLEGRVVTESGEPVPAATVILGVSRNYWITVTDLTRDDGSFRLEAAPHGLQTLLVEGEGLAPLRQEIEIPEGADRVTGIELVMPAGRCVSGRVIDSQGQGISGVHVISRLGREEVQVMTGTRDDGSFVLEPVPTGDVTLRLSQGGWEDEEVSLPEGEIDDLLVTMRRAGRVAGRVVDGITGEPIPEFRIRLDAVSDPAVPHVSLWAFWFQEGRRFSDPRGEWDSGEDDFPVGGLLDVEAYAEGYAPTMVPRVVVQADPDPAALVIELFTGRRVTGRVVSASTGLPIADALVRRVTDSTGELEDGYRTHSDAYGEFALNNVPRGRMSLAVQHDDFPAEYRDDPFEVRASGPDPDRVIRVGGASLTVHLFDEQGAVLVGREVLLRGFTTPGDFEKTGITDREGSFVFPMLQEGTYHVGRPLHEGETNLVARGCSVTIESATDEVEVEVRAGGSATLVGRLVCDVPLPPETEIHLVRSPDAREGRFAEVLIYGALSRDGGFEVRGLPEGTYFVSAYFSSPGARAHYQCSTTVTMESGATTDVTLELLRR